MCVLDTHDSDITYRHKHTYTCIPLIARCPFAIHLECRFPCAHEYHILVIPWWLKEAVPPKPDVRSVVHVYVCICMCVCDTMMIKGRCPTKARRSICVCVCMCVNMYVCDTMMIKGSCPTKARRSICVCVCMCVNMYVWVYVTPWCLKEAVPPRLDDRSVCACACVWICMYECMWHHDA